MDLVLEVSDLGMCFKCRFKLNDDHWLSNTLEIIRGQGHALKGQGQCNILSK